MSRHHDRGMATAEYCVGSIGTIFVAFWLYKLAAGDLATSWFGRLVHGIISHALAVGDLFERWQLPWLM